MAAPDELTVVVFKDNLSSRSFQVPLRWFSWLGLALGVSIGCAALASAVAWRYFRVARTSDPARIQEIESTLGQLRLANRELESRLAQVQSLPATQEPAQPPAPTPAPAMTQTPAPIAPAAGALLALPAGAEPGPLPDPATLPFHVEAPKFEWKGNLLAARFPILYRATDGGSQQGRIVLLARGPSAVLAYPAGVVNGPDRPALIEPERGEYFSVSRYREVTAEFGPAATRQALTALDILIFNTSGRLLLRQGARVPEEKPRSQVAPAPRTRPPAPAKPAEPAPAEYIQPGVDQ